MKCARVVTNTVTNLLCYLENKHTGVASVKALVSNKNKNVSVASGPETVHSIESISNTYFPLSTTVTMKKSFAVLVKHYVFCWLVGSGTPFQKKFSP